MCKVWGVDGVVIWLCLSLSFCVSKTKLAFLEEYVGWAKDVSLIHAGFLKTIDEETKANHYILLVGERRHKSCQKWVCTFKGLHLRCFGLWLTWRYSSTSTCPLWFVSISFKTSWICSPVTFSPPWAWGGVRPVRTQRARICRGCPFASRPSLMKVPPQSSPNVDSVVFELLSWSISQS